MQTAMCLVKIKMAARPNLSFASLYYNYCLIIMDLCLQNSFKINTVDIYTPFEGDKAAGKKNFQFLVFEVVDSQQWSISFDKM